MNVVSVHVEGRAAREEEGEAMSLRPIKQISQPKPTIEGAGVKLQRAFGFGKTKDFDPFLLLDDFRNDNPEDHLAGFPWHPRDRDDHLRACGLSRARP